MSVETKSTDVLVIGSGPGGYVAAIRAGQLDMDAAVVEMEDIGGTCLNRGCIPSKALIKATTLAYRAENAERMGIQAEVSIDYQRLARWKDRVVRRLTKGISTLFKGNGVREVHGRAEFVSDSKVRILDEEGDIKEYIEFDNAIVATGSVPTAIPGFSFDADPILDSRDVLNKTEVPDSMVIIGGGYISFETADVLAKSGCDVKLVGRPPHGLRGYDKDLVKPVLDKGKEIGIDFHFGMEAREWWENEDGTVTVSAFPVEDEDDNELREYTGEEVMVAIGRTPRTDTANLEAAGVKTDDWGQIEVNDRLETNVDGIYAIGDVLGEPMLAHRASHQGIIAAEVIAGMDSSMDYETVPAAVFSDPEIAVVGLSEEEAEEAGINPVVGKFPFRASGRAVAQGDRDGFVRVIADEDERIIGGQVVGPEASELIAEITLAIENEATMEDVADTIHTHPTLSEAVMEACEAGLGRPIHILKRRK